MDRIVIEKKMSFSVLHISLERIGNDWNAVIQGGEKPHIGCSVLAIPRLSLKGNKEISVTSSVLNVTGHKDEELCRYLAEKIARVKNGIVVCSGGFHMDSINEEQIKEVIDTVKESVENEF